jgi:hypothetical protein
MININCNKIQLLINADLERCIDMLLAVLRGLWARFKSADFDLRLKISILL